MVGGEKQIISGAGTRHTGIFSLKGEQFWVISLSFRYLKNTVPIQTSLDERVWLCSWVSRGILLVQAR